MLQGWGASLSLHMTITATTHSGNDAAVRLITTKSGIFCLNYWRRCCSSSPVLFIIPVTTSVVKFSKLADWCNVEGKWHLLHLLKSSLSSCFNKSVVTLSTYISGYAAAPYGDELGVWTYKFLVETGLVLVDWIWWFRWRLQRWLMDYRFCWAEWWRWFLSWNWTCKWKVSFDFQLENIVN